MTTHEPIPPAPLNGSTHPDGQVTPEPSSSFDPTALRNYLGALIPPMIGAAPEDVESILDYGFEERVAKFSGEGGGALYIVKVKDNADGTSFDTLSCVFALKLPRGHYADV